MNNHWTYLLTTIFFAGIGNIRIWYRHGGFLKRHWKYIIAFVIITLPITIFEYFARRWGAWNYHPEHVFNIHIFGAELETYVFMALVAAALAGASFTYAQMEDQRKIKHRSKRRHSSRPALAWPRKS